ncbi:hypothetical protein TWF569_008368 [Orbilia oligospora]|uniref:Uncharacterized protein n=1 Tax=Orbilia oligospora TaxID=2813651 RepID=A0A7C8NBD3_ORBOL|nr:hypothetical protein TWF103_002107 [Orbilia oligospora]KAF3088707.1 hypothetical protein TWF102_010080 [Orbilia oligospora]KAF3106797.1 hypothetical protein TWF706_003290 [Orbilia oligospora]KAF3139947.1 hypothetical protein TWF569_008368 [Orbilia oligospora]
MSSLVPNPRTIRLIAPVAVFLTVAFLVIHTYKSPGAIIPNIGAPDVPNPPPIHGGYDNQDGANDKGSFRFQPPEASVQHSVVRGDKIVWTNDNGTVWQSVGRDPNRPECWTYEDRFGIYKQLSPEISKIISNNNKNSKNRRAVVLRLGGNQAWKSHFIWHVRSLVMEAGHLAGYDVIISVHLDMSQEKKEVWLKKVPEELRPLVQTFSTQDLKNWIPKPAEFKNVYEQNHTPVQMFMAQNPKYDFIYTVENDVRLIGRWDTFLADVDAEYAFHRKHQEKDQNMSDIPDLVTFQSVRRPRGDWPWLKADSEKECIKKFGGMENIRSSLGVVWGWSRKLTDSITQFNKDGLNCYFEYFAPSAAYHQDLTTFFYQHPLYCPNRPSPSERHSMAPKDLGKNDPRLVQYDKVAVGCTYYFVNVHAQPFWDTWYRNPEACRPPALVHPIKGDFFN